MRQKIRLFDYHTHVLEHGLDRPLRIEETVKMAIERGFSAICLTDHYPLPPGYQDPTSKKDCAMPMSLYLRYQNQVERIAKRYESQVEILRGAEFDWLPDYKNWTAREISKWSFDYVIGSIHLLGQIEDKRRKRNFIIDYKENEFKYGIAYYRGIQPFIEAYYKQVQAMAKSGLFDGVGHLDLVNKYNDGSLFSEDEPWYQNAVLETLEAIKEVDMVIEINTSGIEKKCRNAYPSLWILKEARKRGIELIIGSDGHKPEAIGRNLDKAIDLANSAGYTRLIRFIKRKRKEIAI